MLTYNNGTVDNLLGRCLILTSDYANLRVQSTKGKTMTTQTQYQEQDYPNYWLFVAVAVLCPPVGMLLGGMYNLKGEHERAVARGLTIISIESFLLWATITVAAVRFAL